MTDLHGFERPPLPPPPPWLPPPPAPPGSAGSRRARPWIASGLVAALVACVGGGYVLGHRSSTVRVLPPVPRAAATTPTTVVPSAPAPAAPTSPAPVTAAPTTKTAPPGIDASSPLLPSSGKAFFTDTFRGTWQGWGSGTIDGVTYAMTSHGLHATMTGPYDDFLAAPYPGSWLRLGQAVTATVTHGTEYSGFGAVCRRNVGKPSSMDYEFGIDRTGWYVQRRNKSGLQATDPHILDSGTSVTAGAKPVTLVADCIDLPGKKRTRLVLFVNGTKVSDFVDTSPATGAGWYAALLTAGTDHGSTAVTFTGYAEATLSTGSIAGDAT